MMPSTTDTRPCKFCVASVEGYLVRVGSTSGIAATAEDCEYSHRDDPRVYALATAMAKAMQSRSPTDEQISWFLEDADEVVDNFDPAPEKWSVRKLPLAKNDQFDEIEVRLRINDVTYVALEGGKDCRGSVVQLAEFRSWGR